MYALTHSLTPALQTKEFSYTARLPVINENCPACFEEPKERHRVKKMLSREVRKGRVRARARVGHGRKGVWEVSS